MADSTLQQLGPQAQTAWKFYAIVKSKVMEQVPGSLEDYWIEVGSRDALAEYWDEAREPAGRESDAYLDALVKVRRAGHMEEYVLAGLARPGWTIPEDMLASLEIETFLEWSEPNLVGHEVQTMTGVQRGDAALSPSVPGDDLPSVDDLAKPGAPCEALPQASSAYAAWRDREARLPSVALASSDRAGFLASLAVLRASGTTPGRGVIWVSEKAADLSYLVGFCEMDRNERIAALDPLQTAVRLKPLSLTWRLELAAALIAAKRFDDAERQIQAVIARSEDRCLLGSAWRKKGFLEIERGLLEQADLSYRKSLEYEPGNAVALQELEIVLEQRMQGGAGPAAPYTPPPSPPPTQSACPGA